jgi:HlyD family secretion protein
MPPRFRSDLQCSREEQQGVVFFRVDDPKTQTSFRLYEIEYLIAQKLDGARALGDVIRAVKDEYNFDISEPDLQKFVSQLDSMGFVEKEGGAASVPAASAETKVMDRSKVEVESGVGAEGETELVDADLLAEPIQPADEAELRRLLKSALLHVRQGYIVHARDYFLAARELDPGNTSLAKLVSNLEIMGDASGPAEVDYLWNQACELFPDIAQEVAPQAGSSSAAQDDDGLDDAMSRYDLRGRMLWPALLVALVGVGGGTLYHFAKSAHVFDSTAKVSVVALHAQRIPIYYDMPAESVRAAREEWLQFASSGKIVEVSATPGMRVQADQVLVSLALRPALEKQLAAARTVMKKAEGEHEKVEAKLDKAVQDREAAEADRTEGGRKRDSAKGAHANGKKAKAKLKASKRLGQAAKRERALQRQEAKAKQKLDQARKKVEALEAQGAQKRVHAPFAGLVVEVAVHKGQTANKDQKAVLLRDNLEARLTFTVKDAGSLVVGGDAYVSVARGVPSRAEVVLVQPGDKGQRIEVTLVDPAGAFVDMPPTEFRLARELVDRAFQVPVSALVSDETGNRVLVDLQGRAIARKVEVLSRDAANAVIRDTNEALHEGDRVVVDRIGAEGGAASVAAGSHLEEQSLPGEPSNTAASRR